MAVEQLHAAVLQRSTSVVQQCLQATISAVNRCLEASDAVDVRRSPRESNAPAVAPVCDDGWLTTSIPSVRAATCC